MTPVADLAALAPRYDLAVIGAGPAGLAAAAEAAQAGVRVLLVDQGRAPGGQIYRGLGTAPAERARQLGPDYEAGRALLSLAGVADCDHAAETAVWFLGRDPAGGPAQEIGLRRAGGTRTVLADQVVLATGAIERPMPVPGWTEPGVMTAGAAQILLKASGLVPSGRSVLIGSGPLLWLVAAQYLAFGHRPAMLLDTTPPGNLRAALPGAMDFARSAHLRKGLGLLARVRRAVPCRSGVSDIAIAREGDTLTVSARAGGRALSLPADLVLLHQGVVPNLNLARAAGCALDWDEAQACFRPRCDAAGRSSVPGLWIAGDGGGIVGAAASAASGALVALNALRAAGRIDASMHEARAARPSAALAAARRGRAFLDRLYRPAPGQRRAQGAALACRCEEVSAAALSAIIAATEVQGPNQLKAYSRCGMGPCQGRLCGPGVSETIAAARGIGPAEAGYYTLRPPVVPVTLGELARGAVPGAP